MNEDCGCCEGIEKLTPATTANRPGLSALAYRVGTHGSFLTTMKARLSGHYLEYPPAEPDVEPATSRPLQGLTTRRSNDPAIALLDAWATVANVLTFYQERIANEGYLRTATERRSILELARLIGYKLRPGVAASAHLAYTLDKGSEEVLIPAGNGVQSLPDPGETAQTFETSEPLKARAPWSIMLPRLSRPQRVLRWREDRDPLMLYLKGTATKLEINDPLLVVVGLAKDLYRVTEVAPDTVADRTRLRLTLWRQRATITEPPPTTVVGRLTGTVRDVNGAVVPAAPVTITNGLTGESRTLTTSDEGVFRATLSPGNYAVAVSAPGFGTTVAPQQVEAASSHTLNITLWRSTKSVAGSVDTSAVTKVLERHLDLDRAGVSAKTVAARTVVSHLEKLRSELTPDMSAADAQGLIHKTLPELKEVRDKPSTKRSAVLSKWIDNTITELEQAASSLTASDAGNVAPTEDAGGQEATVSMPAPTAAMTAPVASAPVDAAHRPSAAPATSSSSSSQQPGKAITAADLLNVILPDQSTQPAAPYSRSSMPEGQRPQISSSIQGEAQNVISLPDSLLRMATVFNPAVASLIYKVIANAQIAVRSNVEVYALRVKAGLFGSNASKEPQFEPRFLPGGDTQNLRAGLPTPQSTWLEWETALDEDGRVLFLDKEYEKILPRTYVAVLRPDMTIAGIYRNEDVDTPSRNAYGVSGPTTRITLAEDWWTPEGDQQRTRRDMFSFVRRTTVFAEAELLPLAEAPVTEDVCSERIELDGIYDGLEAGRWLIISGERTDVDLSSFDPSGDEATHETAGHETTERSKGVGTAATGADSPPANGIRELSNARSVGATDATAQGPSVPGIAVSELVRLAGVEHGVRQDLPGDMMRTTIVLTGSPVYCYKRDTVKIYGNVVKATHGETRQEVLGSGDGSQAMQSFGLRQSPLTYVSAATASGIESTLRVRVNDILWHETESLAFLGPTDHNYITQTDDESKTTVIFGNGKKGARLPTGIENVTAVYRSGIGKAGNVKADKLTSLISKPLGVKSVVNPLAATGGADRESRDQARRNAPLAVMSLDRLVSVRDYEDFARTFAGIGKASAARLTDGLRQVVHLTIAGADDIPISPESDLFQNLYQALHKFGDPFQPVKITIRELKVLAIAAAVRLHPDYMWESVEPKIRQALLARFSFTEREFGQDALLSEVISAIQAVAGVVFVDVDKFDTIERSRLKPDDLKTPFSDLKLKTRITVDLATIDPAARNINNRIRPAQLALLSPIVPELLMLTESKV